MDSVDDVMVVRVRCIMMSHTLELEVGEVSRAGRGAVPSTFEGDVIVVVCRRSS